MKPDVFIDWETAENIACEDGVFSRLLSRIRGEDPDLVDLDPDSAWRAHRVLYAYIDPDEDEVVYLGKVWDGDVWKRFHAADKKKVWDKIADEFDLARDDLIVLEHFSFPHSAFGACTVALFCHAV